MPLFMTIVGFFSVGSLKKSFWATIRKKIIQLIIPGIVFGVIICLIMKYMVASTIIDTLLFSIWFLKCTFLCYIVFLCSHFFKKRSLVYLVLTALLSQVVFTYQFNLMYPCFLFGVLLNYRWESVRSNALKIAIGSGLIFVIMLIPWNSSFWQIPSGGIYPVSKLWQLTSFIGEFYYRMALGFVGSLFFITFCQCVCMWLSNNILIGHFSKIGRETLGIYLLQTIVVETLIWRWLKFDSVDSLLFSIIIAPIISIIVLYLCLIMTRFLRKNRLTALLFLGETK